MVGVARVTVLGGRLATAFATGGSMALGVGRVSAFICLVVPELGTGLFMVEVWLAVLIAELGLEIGAAVFDDIYDARLAVAAADGGLNMELELFVGGLMIGALLAGGIATRDTAWYVVLFAGNRRVVGVCLIGAGGFRGEEVRGRTVPRILP